MAAARDLLAAAAAVLTAQMQQVRPAVWVRPLGAEHWAVLAVKALKGAQYDLVYGVSCAWVPHVEGDALRWHRTPRRPRLDLWEDHFTAVAPARRWVTGLHGRRTASKQAAGLAQQVSERAPAWWSTVSSPEGILEEARRQAAAPLQVHSPPPRYVAAFTLARLGELAAAEEELASVTELSHDLRAQASLRLRQLAPGA
ncbi:MAG TPA: hypothetical protein VF165_08390 [Nocardioidaceae bacterium]